MIAVLTIRPKDAKIAPRKQFLSNTLTKNHISSQRAIFNDFVRTFTFYMVRALRVKVDLHLRWLTTENFKITKH